MAKNKHYTQILSSALNGFKWDTSRFIVHHIDHNRGNNDIKNLVLIPTKLHAKYHLAAREIQSICPRLFGKNVDIRDLETNMAWINQFLGCKVDMAILKELQEDTIQALSIGLHTPKGIADFYRDRIEYIAQKYD